jgi:hypothetical protein
MICAYTLLQAVVFKFIATVIMKNLFNLPNLCLTKNLINKGIIEWIRISTCLFKQATRKILINDHLCY